MLRAMDARGDHGVHAVVPSPDGKSLFLITGNSTKPAELAESSQVPKIWGEDHLLPSFPDGRGHNRGVLAPGGIIYRVDPDGKNFEAYANGFRNIFDAAFNRDGELFLKAANYRGGASFAKFIEFIRNDAVASLSQAEKKSLKEVLAKKPAEKSALENLGEIFAGRSETKWTLDELSLAARTNLKQRNFANGRKMFAAAGCYACHRFDNQGG